MGKQSNIQWTNSTVNFWVGCKKVSAGCKVCYMYRDLERWGHDPSVVRRTADNTFYAALKWKEPMLVFTCSYSDFFIDEADQWRADAWKVIRDTPHLTWQILTKRIERVRECLPEDWGDGYPNVWIGVSVENQEAADLRIPQLIAIPAVVRFLSCEPLLELIDLRLNDLWCDQTPVAHECTRKMDFISWVLVGGESGHKTGKYTYRICEQWWIQRIVEQCDFSNVPVFVKQMGTHLARLHQFKDNHGGDIEEWSPLVKIREFPILYKQPQ